MTGQSGYSIVRSKLLLIPISYPLSYTPTTMPDSLTTLTKLHPQVHLITLSSPPDNRLTPEFLKSLNDNLDAVELEWRERGGGMSPPDPSKKDVKVEGGGCDYYGY